MKSLEQIATGFRAPGHNAAQFVVVIGEHGSGKTQYALGIAASLALMSRPLPVLLYAPGADKRVLMRRLIETWKPVGLPTLRARTRRLRIARLFVETRPRLWPLELWMAARDLDRRLRRRGSRLRLILIDDLHRMGGRSYAQRISDLKQLARQHFAGVSVIALARPHPSLIRAIRTERVASTSLPASENP